MLSLWVLLASLPLWAGKGGWLPAPMTDILPWRPMMKKGTACLPEYPRTRSESKNNNCREKNGRLNIFSPYAVSRNKTSWVSICLSSQLCLSAVLGTSVVAPLAIGLVSIYLEILLCGHYPWASSHVFFILCCSQASLVPQFLLVFAIPAPDHETSWTAWCSLSARFSHNSSSVLAPCSEEWGTEWHTHSRYCRKTEESG